MNSTELKPCPFCNGEAWSGAHTVQCSDCGAVVTKKGGADKEWNTRHGDTETEDYSSPSPDSEAMESLQYDD